MLSIYVRLELSEIEAFHFCRPTVVRFNFSRCVLILADGFSFSLSSHRVAEVRLREHPCFRGERDVIVYYIVVFVSCCFYINMLTKFEPERYKPFTQYCYAAA